ncbi:unnamed protein product [Pleuronectes platessa]|uniref:G-protein coupled receptors family 1 profile domain-containing protein n=1 Tax=Pleuronectes platessa TaxID=8262 RepID=A0A9N7VRG0_PLEPL|nr:unnamed protein product [Pleuronectes platessa]
MLAVSLPLWAHDPQNLASCRLMTGVYQIEADDPRCEPLYPDDMLQFWKMQRNFSENTVGLFVCLPIMIFCYVKILVVLSTSRNSQKGKAVKLIFIIVCVFVVCWVPYNVIVFLKTLQLFDMMNDCDASKTINSSMCFAEITALAHSLGSHWASNARRFGVATASGVTSKRRRAGISAYATLPRRFRVRCEPGVRRQLPFKQTNNMDNSDEPEDLLDGKIVFQKNKDRTFSKTKVICTLCEKTLSFHRSNTRLTTATRSMCWSARGVQVECAKPDSLAGHIVQKKRSALLSENLNKLVCLTNWLKTE